MNEKDKANRWLERRLLLLYSIYTVIMAVASLAVGWERWIAPLALLGLAASWVCVERQYKTYRFRAFFVSSMCLMNFVIYGAKAEDFFSTLTVMGALAVMLAVYSIPEIMHLVAVVSAALLLYHVAVAHTIQAPASALEALRMLLQISSVFTIELLTYSYVKKQLNIRKELLETIETLKEAEKSKDHFVANVSHEIRTPINTICGISDALRMKATPGEFRESMDDIYTAGHSLLAIVSDILDFSEFQSGKCKLTREPYNLASTLNDVLNILMFKKEEKNLDIQLECSDNIPSGMLGDEQKIKRVLLNLAGNAVKFTQEGRVVIKVDARRESYGVNLSIAVRDTGIGMKPEQVEMLFRSFNQADMGTSRQEGGIGLGLAIAQLLVRKMDGFITVKSEFGRGSEFQFVIPQKVLDYTPIPQIKFNAGMHELDLFHAPTARILVVDDNEMNLKVVQGLLKPYEIQVYTAGSGEDALLQMEENLFDFVFMDHMMPKMDGVETLHRIRQKPGKYFQKVPVIALTANAIGGAREMFLSEGFQDYVAKPINLSALERVLRKYIPENKIKPASPSPETLPEKEPENKGFSLRGIDTEVGRMYCGGQWEDYLDVVRVFVSIGEQKLDNLRHFYENKDWENYVIQVHALKSTSRGIGAQQLSQKAEFLEKAGKENRPEDILENHEAMMQEYTALLDALKQERQLFPEGFSTKPAETAPQKELSGQELMPLLARLEEQLDSFEKEEVDRVLEELFQYQYQGRPMTELLLEIREKTEAFDFTGAKEELDKLKERLG